MSTPSSVVVQYPVTVLLAPFTMPIVGNTAMATVGAMQWMVIGQTLSVAGLGILSVVSTPSATSVVLENTGATGNAMSGTVALAGASVGVAGTPGTPGQTFGQTNTTLVNGLNSNVATGGNQTLRIGGPTGPYWIGGLTPPTSGDFATLVIVDTTGQLMGVMNADASSTAAWQINVDGAQTGSIHYAQPKAASEIELTYDFTALAWKLTSFGPYRADAVDPRDYGADPNGILPSAAQIQAALAVAIAQGKTLSLDGVFSLEHPIFVTAPCRIKGANYIGTILENNSTTTANWNGPTLVVAAPGVAPTFNAESGGVTSATFDHNHTINFSKAGLVVLLPGVTAFTFEFYVNPLSGTLTDDDHSVLFSSFGISEDGHNNCLQIELTKYPGQPTNSVSVSLNTTAGVLSLWPTTIPLPANTLTHVALTFDGTSLRLFIAGVLVGTATGTPGSLINPHYKEDFCLGQQYQSWPSGGNFNTLQNPTNIAEVRVSYSVLYTSTFTPPTGPLSAPLIGDLLRFGSAFTSSVNPQWAYLSSYSTPSYAGVCWYVVDQNAVNNILQGVTISDLHIYGTNATLYQQLQEGIRLQQVYNAVIERISFDLLRVPIVCDKNCVSGEIAHLNVPTGGGNNQHPAPGGYAAIVIALNSGPVVHDVESNGFFYWGIITNAGGMTARNFVANYLQMGLIWDAGQTQGGNGVNGSIYENVEWDDEGSGLAECVLMLGYKTSLKFSGSIILGATTSPPVAATIKVQNCTNMVFEGTSITAPNSTNGYIFTFLGSTFVGDGIGAKQVIPIRITNQGLGTNGHWIDPANPGEIVIEGQEVSGFVTSNFASNATMTVSFDNFLNHTMQFTDTGAVLTGTTIVKLPAWWIREREIVNWTAQTLTIQGPSAPAAWLTATAYAVGAQVTHGGYTYSCTTAITSSATAPTATAYGATNADAGGAWTCFGPTQTISVPSGTRAKIWSDGVQFYLT